MPQIPETCEFEVQADQIEFRTITNGEHIIIKDIQMSQNAAATLAWLINTDNHLTVEIKLTPPP
jgi:hypothetical protein